MRKFEKVLKSPRLTITDVNTKTMRVIWAYLSHPEYKPKAVVIVAGWDERAKDGKPLEHVSVSLDRRCPTWNEMSMIKDIFWEDEECVVQFHPPKSQYVNTHPYCLHMWRKVGWETEMDW